MEENGEEEGAASRGKHLVTMVPANLDAPMVSGGPRHIHLVCDLTVPAGYISWKGDSCQQCRQGIYPGRETLASSTSSVGVTG